MHTYITNRTISDEYSVFTVLCYNFKFASSPVNQRMLILSLLGGNTDVVVHFTVVVAKQLFQSNYCCCSSKRTTHVIF
jgi:hypothetical protein